MSVNDLIESASAAMRAHVNLRTAAEIAEARAVDAIGPGVSDAVRKAKVTLATHEERRLARLAEVTAKVAGWRVDVAIAEMAAQRLSGGHGDGAE